MDSSINPIKKALQTNELLDMILLSLTTVDRAHSRRSGAYSAEALATLYRCQRVCKDWDARIKTSRRVQRAMFILKDVIAYDSARYDWTACKDDERPLGLPAANDLVFLHQHEQRRGPLPDPKEYPPSGPYYCNLPVSQQEKPFAYINPLLIHRNFVFRLRNDHFDRTFFLRAIQGQTVGSRRLVCDTDKRLLMVVYSPQHRQFDQGWDASRWDCFGRTVTPSSCQYSPLNKKDVAYVRRHGLLDEIPKSVLQSVGTRLSEDASCMDMFVTQPPAQRLTMHIIQCQNVNPDDFEFHHSVYIRCRHREALEEQISSNKALCECWMVTRELQVCRNAGVRIKDLFGDRASEVSAGSKKVSRFTTDKLLEDGDIDDGFP